jgi:hypothetical protein
LFSSVASFSPCQQNLCNLILPFGADVLTNGYPQTILPVKAFLVETNRPVSSLSSLSAQNLQNLYNSFPDKQISFTFIVYSTDTSKGGARTASTAHFPENNSPFDSPLLILTGEVP